MRPRLVIAVVDDDPAVLQALDRLIRSRGCESLTFASGLDFLNHLASRHPDFLIIDVQLPGMSGLELYSRVLDLGLRFPVVFITAHEDHRAEQMALERGAVGLFHKPFRGEVLWQAIDSAMAEKPSHSDNGSG